MQKSRAENRGKSFILWLLLLGMLFTGCTDGSNAQTGAGESAGYAKEEAAGEQTPGNTAGADTGSADAGKTSDETAENGEVHICFLKTAEDADCIIIRSGQSAVMIDTGEEQDGERMLEELKGQGITAVDYLILTHPDKDHVGGAALLLDSLPVSHVVEPAYVGEEKKEERLERINKSCEEKGIPVVCLTDKVLEISAGYVELTVYPPQEAYYEKANNYSLAVLAGHGEVHMFFTGDALRIRSEELLEIELPEIDLYKVPHHGRANKATEEMFEKVSPKYAVVTADAAEAEVIQSCEKLGAQLFLTGEQSWEFISDGKELRPADRE